MTLEEELIEEIEIKDMLLTAYKNNVSSGILLGYTTNSTKVTYEGSTRTLKLLENSKNKIATINSMISQQEVSS